MGRQGTIKRHGREILEKVYAWFDDGCTIRDVQEYLEGLGVKVSHSAVGRERQDWAEITAQARESREVAAAFARSFRDAPESAFAMASMEVLHMLILRFLRAQSMGEEVTLKPAEMMHLTKAVLNLTSARKSEVDTTLTAEKAAVETVAPGAEATQQVMAIEFVDPTPVEPTDTPTLEAGSEK